VDRLHADASASQHQLDTARQQLRTVEKANNSLQQQLQTLQETHAEVLRNSESQQRSLAAATTTAASSQAHAAELTQQLTEQLAQLETAQQTTAELQAQLEDERTHASTSHDGLSQARQALVGELAQCKTALSQAQQHLAEGKAREASMASHMTKLQAEVCKGEAVDCGTREQRVTCCATIGQSASPSLRRRGCVQLEQQAAQSSEASHAAQSMHASMTKQLASLQSELMVSFAHAVLA